jgi:hypothetical protein
VLSSSQARLSLSVFKLKQGGGGIFSENSAGHL